MRKIWVLPLLLAVVVSTVASAAQSKMPSNRGQIDLSDAKVIALDAKSKIQAKAADMLRDEIEKRTRIGLEVVTLLPAKGIPSIVIGGVPGRVR